jgi:hypothetical protein
MKVQILHKSILLFLCLISITSQGQQALLSSGGNSADGLVSYSFGQFAYMTYSGAGSSVAQGVQHPWEMYGSSSGTPLNLEIANDTYITSTENCFGAQQTITVAGIAGPVDVQSGATVRFIAGESVRFLPGFHARESSSVHAYITTDGTFCDGSPSPSIVQLPTSTEKSTSQNPSFEEPSDQPFHPQLKAFPNPNNGQFALEIINFKEQTEIVVFNMAGKVIYRGKSINNITFEMNLPYLAKGIYNILVTDGLTAKSVKMIVQ